MAIDFQIRVYRNREPCFTTTIGNNLEIGRQRPGEPAPFHLTPDSSRLIIAPIDDKLVSRQHILFEVHGPEHDPKIGIRNLSRKRSVQIDVLGRLAPEETVELPTPILVSFEDFAIRVESLAESVWHTKSLLHPTLAPGSFAQKQVSVIAQQSLMASQGGSYPPEQLMKWLSEMLGVLQSAAATSDYLAEAVQAVDRILGMDSIDALRYENGSWRIESSQVASESQVGSDSRSPSRTILGEVVAQKRTIYQVPSPAAASASLQGVKALVASPILDSAGQVIGALYGARYSNPRTPVPQISELEATMVEVIACSAAAGLEREKQQQKALEARVLFEQFFTPQLARELEKNPRMLEGDDAEISVLFCDVAGFSSTSSRIGPRLTMEWISAIMDLLSEVVLSHDGVVVDYIGDELMAMWGAPKKQPDHAMKACAASQALMACKPKIDAAWRTRIGSPIDFRIGISSGIASVGNIGTTRRLKYGPLGNTVNLASRLQSAAKHFGVRELASQATVDAFQPSCPVEIRPLGNAQFVNIPTPTHIYELGYAQDQDFVALAEGFRAILPLLHHDRDRALPLAADLSKRFPQDQPARMLLRKLESESINPACLWPLENK